MRGPLPRMTVSSALAPSPVAITFRLSASNACSSLVDVGATPPPYSRARQAKPGAAFSIQVYRRSRSCWNRMIGLPVSADWTSSTSL
jgi:hypothetical protein